LGRYFSTQGTLVGSTSRDLGSTWIWGGGCSSWNGVTLVDAAPAAALLDDASGAALGGSFRIAAVGFAFLSCHGGLRRALHAKVGR
jgi:hypothetical protein